MGQEGFRMVKARPREDGSYQRRVTEMKSRGEGAETDNLVPRPLSRRVAGREGKARVNSGRVAGCEVVDG